MDELVTRMKAQALAWAVIAGFALVGVVFLLVALNGWFSVMWGPVVGPLVLGGGALAIALTVWAVMTITANISKRRELERRHAAEKTALVTTAAVTALPLVLQSGLMRKLGLPVGGALAAAYLLTRSGGHKADE
ncbi:hypothetical protein [Devosia sp.]|uniref:hypothetical protein n=1 Tax=Devosia sp. TaxID=1871048 RepID=UPI003A8F2C39